MFGLTDYTTPNDIRAVLSVTDGELEDAVLASPIFYTTLLDNLGDISSGLQTLYESLLPTAEAELTSTQQKFMRRMHLFASYDVAVQLLNTLPLLAVQSEQDARAQYERFEKPFERVDASVRATYALARKRLSESFNELGGNVSFAAIRTLVLAAGLGTDPVTG